MSFGPFFLAAISINSLLPSAAHVAKSRSRFDGASIELSVVDGLASQTGTYAYSGTNTECCEYTSAEALRKNCGNLAIPVDGREKQAAKLYFLESCRIEITKLAA